jgi:hypothetical protein
MYLNKTAVELLLEHNYFSPRCLQLLGRCFLIGEQKGDLGANGRLKVMCVEGEDSVLCSPEVDISG